MKAKTMKYRVLCHILVFLLCVSGLVAQTVVKDSAQVVVQSTQQIEQVQSEQRIAQNTLLLELSFYPRGYATEFWYSLNYERLLNDNISLSIGATLTRIDVLIPISWHGFLGNGGHRFEMSGGVLISPRFVTIRGFDLYSVSPILRVGYRYQPLQGGFNAGIAFSPLFNDGSYYALGGTISLGWGF